MKKIGVVLLTIGLVLVIAAFAVQGVAQAKWNEFTKDVPFIGGKLSPSFVQSLIKSESDIRNLERELRWFGINTSELDTIILGLKVYVATPTMMIVGSIMAVAGLVLAIIGALNSRKATPRVDQSNFGNNNYSNNRYSNNNYGNNSNNSNNKNPFEF